MKTEPLNPYESPREISLPLPPSPRKQLLARLRGPSIGLLLLSGLQAFSNLVTIIVMLAMLIVLLTRGSWYGPRDFWRAFGTAIFAFTPSAFIFIGALQMRRMRTLRLCRAAAILACIPLLTPMGFLGIPLGIWAAIVLYQKSTAEEFNRPVIPADEDLE